jgi:MFS family permease
MVDNTVRGRQSDAGPASMAPAKRITAAVLGNALEFYDFTVFAAFAVFIGHAFFPTHNPYASVMLSVATFGVGFVTRPLGGIVIGAYADRAGRKPAMTLTIWLMAIGSAAIGILPTYDQIGVAAPILLVLARLLQGFSTGGEMGPATTYIVESAPAARKSLFGSWQLSSQNIGVLIGGIVGFILARLLPDSALSSWGWRIPFLLGILIAPVGIYIRNQLEETLDTSRAHESGKAVVADLFKRQWKPLLLGFLLIPGATIAQYFMIYATTFAISTLHMPSSVAFGSNMVIGISGVIFALVGGWLGDRFGLKAISFWPRLVLMVIAYPAVLLVVHNPTAIMLFSVFFVLAALQAASGAVGIVLIARCFPAAVRTAGLSIAYAIGVTIFGGSAQVIFTWLIHITGNPMAPVWWVVVTNVVTLAAILALREVPEEAAQGRRVS